VVVLLRYAPETGFHHGDALKGFPLRMKSENIDILHPKTNSEMKISLIHDFDHPSGILIIPMAGGDSLEASLAAVEPHTGVKAELLHRDFKADQGEVQILYAGGKRIFLVGLGVRPDFAEMLKAFRSFSFKYKQKLSREIDISLMPGNLPDNPATCIEAAVNGLMLGVYRIGRFKTSNGEPHPLSDSEARINIIITKDHAELAREAAEKGLAIAETQLGIFDLVNAPGNKKLPDDLAAWAVTSGKKYGYKVDVFDKQKIEATGLHALLAVNRGSEYPPVFIVMEYQPKKSSRQPLKTIGLVGKGVTFDTGGLSIKPSSNMHYMKSDMGGAGAVFGAIELAAKLQLPLRVVGIVPATDNSVDARSMKPSDVIGSYSGKTIEIIDTDAEGRLVLADGLSYMAKHFQTDAIIDLATLTGSAVRTLGYFAACLFANNDDLASLLLQVGERTGERLWRLPMWDVYKDDIKSDVADVRNFSGKPVAGAIGAAKFLEVFIEEHPAWAHLDIAGVAFNDSEFASQKSATAYGVRLLTEFLIETAKQ
jgi:leucyl aminopeptidase